MKLSTCKKIGLAVVAAMTLGIASTSALANSCSAVYRTYYLDRNCQYYYIDAMGNKVAGGQYNSGEFTGLNLHKDCCGNRWYSIDAFGNKKYVSKRCA